MVTNEGKILSLWIRGELLGRDDLWQKWEEAIIYLTSEIPVTLTHVEASSPSFRSDKYLLYSRLRKRLNASFSTSEQFDYLGFAAIPEVVTSMADDLIFRAILRKNIHQEILIYFNEERFPLADREGIESLSKSFFVSGRVEWFRSDRGDFPGNYLINFHHPNGYKPRGFESLKVVELRRATG